MIDWFIFVIWISTLFVVYHFGFDHGVSVGEVRERLKWALTVKGKNKKEDRSEEKETHEDHEQGNH